MKIEIGDPQAPIVSLDEYRIERSSKYCDHAPVSLDVNARAVKCRRCGAPVDAFDALLKIANEHEHLVMRWTRLRKAADVLGAHIDDLKRIEGNARARLKRLGVVDAPRRPYL